MNINRNADRFFPSVFCGDLYRLIFSLLTLSVNTNENVSLVYIEGIAVEIEGIKKIKQYDGM